MRFNGGVSYCSYGIGTVKPFDKRLSYDMIWLIDGDTGNSHLGWTFDVIGSAKAVTNNKYSLCVGSTWITVNAVLSLFAAQMLL